MLCLCEMRAKLTRRPSRMTIFILIVALHSQTYSFAGTSLKSGATIAQTAPKRNAEPFDKLELFCFFAAGPVGTYARYMLQERGADFTPDAEFINSFSSEIQREILRGVRPKTTHKASPTRDQAYQLVWKAYQDQRGHQYPTASGGYQRALQLVPDSATLHLAYAAELLFAKDFAHADEQAHMSSKLWPEYAEAHGMLALSMVLQKRSPEAETESKETLRIFPEHVSAKFTLAQALTNEHKYQEAIPAIRTARAAMPSMTALTKFLGIALRETGDTTGAIAELSSYVKIDPTDAEGHYAYGMALKAKGEREQAHAQLAEAARLQPNNSQYKSAAEN